MDEKRRNQQQQDAEGTQPQEAGSRQQESSDDQTISVGQSDNLQANSGENFYQNRDRGNMPSGDRSDEGGGSLY